MSPKVEEINLESQEITRIEEHLLDSSEIQGRKPKGYDEDGFLDDYD